MMFVSEIIQLNKTEKKRKIEFKNKMQLQNTKYKFALLIENNKQIML